MTAEASGSRYFDVDDIIAGQQRVEATFTTELPELGFALNASSRGPILRNRHADVPVWLAASLRSVNAVSLSLPRAYKSSSIGALDADASSVALSKLAPYFYRQGRFLVSNPVLGSSFAAGTREVIISSLIETLTQRICGSLFSNSNFDTDKEVPHTLDTDERTLYEIGRRCLRSHADWLARRTHEIRASDAILQHRRHNGRSLTRKRKTVTR